MTTRVSVQAAMTALAAAGYVALSLADGGSAILVFSGITFVIWWAVIVGLAIGILPRATVPTTAIVSAVSLGALGLLAALSMRWASDDGLAFIDVARVAGYLGLFLFVVLSSPRGSARVWLGGLALGLAIVAALALGSRFEPGLPGGNEELLTFLPDAAGRLSFPIGYWNALGACMAAGIVLLTWLGALAERRLTRALSVAALPLAGTALSLTQSRGGVVAALVGIGALVLAGPARPMLIASAALGGAGIAGLVVLLAARDELVDGLPTPAAETQGHEMIVATVAVAALVGLVRYLADGSLGRVRVSRPATVTLVAVLAIAAVAGIVLADPVERLDEFNDPPETQTASRDGGVGRLATLDDSGRYQYWSVALDGFESDPLKGVGAGGYEALWNQNAPFTRAITHAHSLFFESLAELGVPGLLCVLGFLAPAGWAVVRRPQPLAAGGELGAAVGLLAAGIVSASIEWTWEFPAAFLPVVIAVGLLTGSGLYRRESGQTTLVMAPAPSGRRGFGWGIPALLAGWASIWVAGVVFFTEAKLEQSESAAARGDLEDAAQDARDAATLQPWASQPWLRLALLEELSGDLEAAQDALLNASIRAPEDWRIWLINTRLAVGLDDFESARESLDQARALNPQAQIFQGGAELPAPEGGERFQAGVKPGSLADQIGIQPQPDPAGGEEKGKESRAQPGVPAHRQAPWAVSRR